MMRSSGGVIARTSEDATEALPRRAMAVLRYLDVVLVAVGVPIALALGAPAFGCLVGAVAWLAQRALAHTDRRWIGRAKEARAQLGLNLFEAFGRIWLLAGAIVLAGVVGGRRDGLTTALVIFAAYSVAFAIRLLSGRPAPLSGRPGPPPGRRASSAGRPGPLPARPASPPGRPRSSLGRAASSPGRAASSPDRAASPPDRAASPPSKEMAR
jgi:hypothetical protein